MNAGEILIQRGLKRGIQEGVAQGRQQGVQQSRTEIAKNLIASGMDVKTIAKCTKLSTKQLAELMSSTTQNKRIPCYHLHMLVVTAK